MQVAIPAGGEDEARAFYSGVLGFVEIDKPAELQARGGAWFTIDDIELHVGVDDQFGPARKAHPAFIWDDIEALATQLSAGGYATEWDDLMPGRRRFYSRDPFDNRLEFIEST